MHKPAALLTVASLARYAGQISVLLVVSALGTPALVGTLTLSLALTAPGFILLGLGMRTLVLTHRASHPLRTYLALRAGSAVLAILVSCIVLVLALGPDWGVAGAGVIALKIADYVLDLATAWYQSQHRWRRLVTLSLAAAIATALGAVVAGALIGPEFAVLGAGSAVLVVATAFGLIPLVQEGRADPRPRWGDVLALARAGIPLGISYGMVGLLVAVPQYFLAATDGVGAAGRFAVIFYLVTAAELLVNPISQAWVQRTRARLGLTGMTRRVLARETSIHVAVFAPVVVVGAVAGWFLIPIVFGDYFAPSASEILAVSLCMLLMPAVYLGASALAIANRYRSSLVVVIPALVIVATASAVLTPSFGVAGAFAALAAGLVLRAAVPIALLPGIEEPS
ncbi:lipopolysaccharide biosynthesis protein [Microbacterium sp. T2.11-28]|uniref:lipopolysaccharide biosynthesis protein n=1 Tax=Microbacterium sp. T2.11-28 TaxID=3041169 RepID=UPI0024774E67|nr:hypothetical protein [Microbacterium sp. T2.11-28]CAI9393646.1 hypothetical protein MICABA_02518 [Microbacterium sp. T2.11-28]